MYATYTQNEDIYTVELVADLAYVETDYATVSKCTTIINPEEYKKNMQDCILQQLGFVVKKNGIRMGFMYNRVYKNRYEGCSIYLPDATIMIIAFKTVFELSEHKKISFIPHKGELGKFKSLTTKTSIQRYQLVGGHINIYKHLIYNKGKKLFYYLGIK